MEPITHRTAEDEQYKTCKCSQCGVVGTCTPVFDFYVLGDAADGKPLLCERCFQKAHGLQTIKEHVA